ncbi:phosphoenolpyruvate carboxykinase (ATP) [Paenibacillus turpanensis]|uniref:phosphoenolpyruvate carboxykinase (ATP) n=1 Tax=Paenibacillus turpanensis TaxID=2689078 RepID=UPI00140BEF49|nr:phosphoenolpyruvate carboxykinase (ATP) [Paenibacillus turpanensis]
MKRHAVGTVSEQVVGGVKVYRDLSVSGLIQEALARKEGTLSSTGALQVTTGAITGRSPKDRYIVHEPSVERDIDWGTVNQPMSAEHFDRLYRKAQEYMSGIERFEWSGYAGTDPDYQIPVHVITEYAWHSLFAQQLFIRQAKRDALRDLQGFTIIDLPGLKADPAEDGTRSSTFICISLEKRIVLIGGTEYAGEMKKSMFSVLNYLLPHQGVLPMHCSANVGVQGDVALFFGLSGTGKTTLSADPKRALIGDDEHGWSNSGVFNFEGGCYAKCAGLEEEKEPQIWRAVRFGAILENVVLDPETRVADYDDLSLTENTRAAYPVEYIEGTLIPGIAGHPNVIIFLTADAFGILPPIAKLTKEQALYHFLSGYTSKLAGTERGVTAPEATFSACFGAPFLPLHPTVYASMLGDKLDRHQSRVYLVNTGWSGGPYGVGRRMNLSYTRAIVSDALSGEMEQASFTPDPVFGFLCPDAVTGVPSELLQPRNTWQNAEEYDAKAKELAARFIANFEKYGEAGESLLSGGPRRS